MIESYLINAGLGCGTVKNFNNEILKNIKLGITDRWYFKTPIKVSGSGLRSASVDFAFPFLAAKDDFSEKEVLDRLELLRADYENDLLRFLRSLHFIVPPDTANFSIIPFWATEPGPRNDRKDFAQIRVHLLNGVITLKYRNLRLPSVVDPVLLSLQNEQSEIERRIYTLTLFVNSPEFSELSETDQTNIENQLAAMTTYNECLVYRINNY